MPVNDDKHDINLNIDKFECISHAVDYLKQVQELQGTIFTDDLFSFVSKVYDEAFENGKYDILDRTIYNMFHEIDKIEEKRADALPRL